MGDLIDTGHQGAAKHPDFGSAEINGRVRVTSEGIQFDAGTSSKIIPFTGLTIDLIPGRRVRFTDPHQPDLAIFTPEDRILALPVLQLMAYYRALAKGLNPDRPTNLDAVVKLA